VDLVTNLIDVPCADAFLHVDQTPARRMPLSQEIRDQRMHTRSREQNGRVILGD